MPDRFPCGLMTSDIHSRRVTMVNQYIADLIERDLEQLHGVNLDSVLSKASLIFMESYVYPSLLDSGIHSELQLSLCTKAGEKLPVVANIRFDGDSSLHWAIFSAIERDKLYQELIEARDKLEEQALELAQLASEDPMTGLWNRRAGKQKMTQMIRQSQRVATHLCVFVVEIDRLNEIRERLGHSEGDRILADIANVLKRHLRRVDIISRWMEQRILVMMYGTTLSQAEEFSRKLQRDCLRKNIEGQPVTLSLGLVELALSDEDAKALLERAVTKADAALYIAKASGMGQLTVLKD